MKIEFLISTMNRKDMSFLYDMFQHNNINNINALVINQCTGAEIPDIEAPHEKIRIISVRDKGLSKSRNMGLKNAVGDIVLPTDDDLVYEPNIVAILERAFESNKDVDLLTFQIKKESGGFLKKYKENTFTHSMRSVLQVASVEIALRIHKIRKCGVVYNELFGLGALYPTGEENIFLKELLKNGIDMKFMPCTIATHPDITSGSILDRNGLYYKGAVFAKMWGILSFTISFLFVIKKHGVLTNVSFTQAVFSAWKGSLNYLRR